MSRKRHSVGQIIGKLRQADVELGQGKTVEEACRGLEIEVGRKLTSDDVIGVLQYLFAIRGIPEHIRGDNGPEFVAKSIRRWMVQAGVSTLFIARSSPWENGCLESFNGKFRDELLNEQLFLGLEDARWVTDRWRLDYNHRRPHNAPGNQTPELPLRRNSLIRSGTSLGGRSVTQQAHAECEPYLCPPALHLIGVVVIVFALHGRYNRSDLHISATWWSNQIR
jgi:hypothetical protein